MYVYSTNLVHSTAQEWVTIMVHFRELSQLLVQRADPRISTRLLVRTFSLTLARLALDTGERCMYRYYHSCHEIHQPDCRKSAGHKLRYW